MKLLLFDIDGTILRSGGAGEIATNKAFLEVFSVKDAWGDVRGHGKTDPLIFQEIALRVLGRELKNQELATLVNSYFSHSEKELAVAPNFRLMPNIVPLLEMLASHPEVVLGIQTGNYRETAGQKLRKGGVFHHFSFGGYACDSPIRSEFVKVAIDRAVKLRKQNFKKEDIFVIGDTIHDIGAAKAVGVKSIAVATGPAPAAELHAAEPDFFFGDFTDTERFRGIVCQ